MTTYNIEGPWRGQLAIIARPRGGDWLAEEVQDWKNEGFDVIVSLLTTDEERDLGLTEDGVYYRRKLAVGSTSEITKSEVVQYAEFSKGPSGDTTAGMLDNRSIPT